MTDLSEIKKLANYRPTHKVRFVTAASLFDGHDASINIMRRILQSMGAEVIHLGHNRSVEEIVTAALQEDVQGIAVSSYQGGHVEFFKYMIDLLRERGGSNIRVYGGGGGVIVPAEIKELHDYGVARIFSPEDGQKMGLQGMIGLMVAECDADLSSTVTDVARCAEGQGPRRNAGAHWRRRSPRSNSAAADAKFREALHKAGRHREGADARHHRHRRRRQVEPDRRTDAPPPARSGRQAEHRGDLDRSVAPQERRRAARRPHPHERDQPVERRRPTVYMRSLATREAGSEIIAGAARRDRGLQGRRLRSRAGRDLGHRPGRCRDRAARGRDAVRDDAGIRRREPAREDRHARLRRLRRDQQVRPQGRGRRVARCQQAGPAQQGRLQRRSRTR